MSEKNYIPISTFKDVQDAVYSCKSIKLSPTRVEILFTDSEFLGYKPNMAFEENIDNLISQYVSHAGSMLKFLEGLGKWEGNKIRSSYSNEYWELLTKWYCYEKSLEEQKQYMVWLKELEPRLKDVQKLKLNGLLETAVRQDLTTFFSSSERMEYTLWVIVSVYSGGYFNVVCKAFNSSNTNTPPELPPCFNEDFKSPDQLNKKISQVVNNYFIECAGKISEFPDHVRVIVNVDQMYYLYPEKWDIYYRNKMMGCLAPVSFKLPSVWDLNFTDRKERQERRNSYSTPGAVKSCWISSLDMGLVSRISKDKQVNLILCHRKPDDVDFIKNLLEKFPYVLFSRDDIEIDTKNCFWMKDCFTSERKDLHVYLKELREEHLLTHDHPLHSLALVWDTEYPYEAELKSLYISVSQKLGY